MATIKAKQLYRIVGLGDSLTFGWQVTSGFFDRFVGRLHEAHLLSAIEAINAGLPGDTAAGALQRLPGLLRNPCNLLFVQFAINDAFSDVTLEDYVDSLRRLVQLSQAAFVTPVLLTSCPLLHPADDRSLRPFYSAMLELAEKEQIMTADLDGYWRSNSAGSLAEDLYLEDGVHPSDLGHQLLADGLWSELSQVIEGLVAG